MGPARSPRALGPHAGLRALSCCGISALPGLPAATSPRRRLSLLPPSLPPFLARSWPRRAPPRAAAGRTRASGKPLGRRGRSARGAGQVRGVPGAPTVNLGNPVRTPPATPRGPQDSSELPPQILPHRYDPVCIPTWMPPDSLCVCIRILRIPSDSHPDTSGPPLRFRRVSWTLSAVSSQPGSLPGLLSPAPAGPWQAGGCSGARTLDAQPIATCPARPCALGPPGACPFGPRLPGQARCP